MFLTAMCLSGDGRPDDFRRLRKLNAELGGHDILTAIVNLQCFGVEAHPFVADHQTAIGFFIKAIYLQTFMKAFQGFA
jgi:hypothetical protein